MKKGKIDVKEQILIIAAKIAKEEGYENLSIRKITKMMNYSPGIVYHYFKNKEEIIDTLLRENYKRIIKELKDTIVLEDDPEKQVKDIILKYIDVSLNHPQEYMSFMLTNKPAMLLEGGNIFISGIGSRRGSLKLLAESIKKGIESGKFKKCDELLTAKLIWLSMFGLLAKIIVDKNEVNSEQKKCIIDGYVEFIINGLTK